jgi:OOP family OmpA-OmpF porin
MNSTVLIAAAWWAIAAAVFAQVKPEFTKDAPGAKDHPMLKRIEGSVILRSATKKFDSFQIAMERVVWDFDAQNYKPWNKIMVEGAHATLFYREPKDASTLECIRAYQEELRDKGFEVIFEGSSGGAPCGENDSLDNIAGRFVQQVYQTEHDYSLQHYTMGNANDYRYTALKRRGEGGTGDAYVTVFCAGVGSHWEEPDKGLLEGTVVARVDVVETKGLQNRMVLVKAAEMGQQLTATGRVALYGIYFDFNQSTLKPESDSTLQEVQKLMASDPNLKLLVVGHTDNVGTFEFNRETCPAAGPPRW